MNKLFLGIVWIIGISLFTSVIVTESRSISALAELRAEKAILKSAIDRNTRMVDQHYKDYKPKQKECKKWC